KTFDSINQLYEKGDIDSMMKNIASDASLTIIGVEDGGFYTGYATVKDALKKAASLHAYKCQTTEQSVNLNKGSDVAWIAQKSDCTPAAGGKSISVRSTAVEVKKDGKWLLIQAHHSIGTPK
ncbi:MAG: nuclear transport factor 2 family protein, partial [Nitrospirae bacterium]|nr:nuclear transport factor 2 family protein [Nitrospirota bacterium]